MSGKLVIPVNFPEFLCGFRLSQLFSDIEIRALWGPCHLSQDFLFPCTVKVPLSDSDIMFSHAAQIIMRDI